MGVGKVFRRQWKRKDGTIAESRFFSIGFPHKGRERVESSKSESEGVAWKLLRSRLEEIGRGDWVPGQQRVRFETLIDLLKADYTRKKNRFWDSTVIHKLKPLEARFDGWLCSRIDITAIDKWVKDQLVEGKSRDTVNGGLRLLRRMFKLGCKHHKLAQAPIIELLGGGVKRTDFVEVGDFNRILATRPMREDEDTKDLVEFLFCTGWRVKAGEGLERSDVDWVHETIRLRAELSKNKEPALISYAEFPRLKNLMLRRKAKMSLDCPWIFHRDGKQIRSFRRRWKQATKQAGLTGLLVHGLCRSAATHMRRAGVDRKVASEFMNRTTDMYEQYEQVATRDSRLAGAALQSYYEEEQESEKIVAIKRN